MTWNYRIVKHKSGVNTWYSLHEVYYDENGEPDGMTQNPISAHGDTRAEVIKALEMMLKDAKRMPVFIPPKRWNQG